MKPQDGSSPLRRRALLQATAAAAMVPAWARAADAGSARVAVVIGNAAYPTAPLFNPAKDALAMAGLLRGLGFQVVEARDAGKAQMQAAVAEAHDRLKGRQGIGMLYYAGHGMQLDWRNYMLPVDAILARAADLQAQAMDIGFVLEAFTTAGSRMNILVLDACRDNPFPAAASGKGLAPMDAPPGTYMAYATAPGNVADDGSTADGNGLYTRFLVKEMQRPDAKIEDVFKRVRLQVRQASQGRQIPWDSTSLEDDFVFATGQKVQPQDTKSRDTQFDAEKADWDRIKESSRAEDFFAFLQRHPNGSVSELAQFRLDQLARPAVQAVAAVKTLPAGVDRYQVGDAWAVQRTDLLKGGELSQSRGRVTAIEGGKVMINGGRRVYDQMGGVLLGRFGAYDPAVMVAPAELQVGKRWRSASSYTPAHGDLALHRYSAHPRRPPDAQLRIYSNHRVVALEELQVPAGRYRAYRIEAIGESVRYDGSQRWHQTTWVDPATMMVVRHDEKISSFTGSRVTEHSSEVLLWLTQVPRA